MGNAATAMRSDEPWAFSQLIAGLDDVLDEEGRPLAERRAPSALKDGVPMELGPCPYADSRQGEPMNLSALEQITRHLKPVFRELRAFHAALPAGSPSHDRMFLAVLDQLAGPARRLGVHTGLMGAASIRSSTPLPAGFSTGRWVISISSTSPGSPKAPYVSA